MTSHSLAAMVGLDHRDLSELIGGLSDRHLTVASAESLTGGLLTALLTAVPGASAVVRGGLIVYATDLKHSLAGVDEVLLADRGPVDPDVAVALADGARRTCRADVGLGLTGVAGPDRQHDVAVGTWYVAIAGTNADRVIANLPEQDGPEPAVTPSRHQVRNAAVRAAVGLLTDLVSGARSAGRPQ